MLLDNQKMTNNIHFEKWTADQVAEWLRGKKIIDSYIRSLYFSYQMINYYYGNIYPDIAARNVSSCSSPVGHTAVIKLVNVKYFF